MDPNGMDYHLLLSQDDWMGEGTSFAPEGSLSYDDALGVGLQQETFRFPKLVGDRQPRRDDRRGVAADRFGNVYWLDEAEHAIRVQSSGSGQSSTFWAPRPDLPARQRGQDFDACEAPPPPQPVLLRGLAVTEDHYLVVGTVDLPGLFVFDLHAPGSRRHELWPREVAFSPYDLCARTGGGVFVLDAANHLLWELDARLNVVTRGDAVAAEEPSDFEDAEGAPSVSEGAPVHRGVSTLDAIPVSGDLVAVETAPDARVLLLRGPDAGVSSTVQLLDPRTGTGLVLPLVDDTDPVDPVRVVAHDLARPLTDRLDRFYVADAEGNQAFAFDVVGDGEEWRLVLSYDYLPMRLFGGKGLVGTTVGVSYDFAGGWVPLVAQKRPRFAETSTYVSRVLDGRLPGTVWHRLMVDGRIPPECRVSIQSRAADDPADLLSTDWLDEPSLTYRRETGTELAYESNEAIGTWEILLQHGTGRHLQLRVLLRGDGRTTPRLRAMRVYYPRFSYVEEYLPAVYQNDAASASFLTRYLGNAEGILSGIEAKIAASHALFDPRTAPAEDLGWLLGWFDLAADPTWSEDRQRLLLRNVMRFLALRGTVAGIQVALRLALDECVSEDMFSGAPSGPGGYRIVEAFQQRQLPPGVRDDPAAVVAVEAEADTRWSPGQGREELTRRWRLWTGDLGAELPLTDPGGGWGEFFRSVVGIAPPTDLSRPEWTRFLTGRYRHIEDLNQAYGIAGTPLTSFEQVGLPAGLPEDGAPLRDWYHFVAVVVPSRSAAHRFTVVLPVPRQATPGSEAQARRAIARRVVELQKPAHTTFDVTFVWVAFQLGRARLGLDSLLGHGGRDPQFHLPVVLGREYVGESRTVDHHPPPVDTSAGTRSGLELVREERRES